VLGASLAIIFGLATVFVFYALLAFQRWRWSVATGYPSWVVADVFCDTRRDTGNLLNGTGDFVFVEGSTRRMMLLLRRARFVTQIVAAVVALAGVSRWLAVWLMGGGSEPGSDVAWHWAVPLAVCFVAYFLLGFPEWRVRRRENIKVTGRTSGENAPPLKSELVKMWMASAERARKSLSGSATGEEQAHR